MATPILQVENLSASYRKNTVLHDINFEVNGGSLTGIVGPNGAGKSTLFNRLVGRQEAIVEDIPGTTRDRLYGETEWNNAHFIVVDTGGQVISISTDTAQELPPRGEGGFGYDPIFYLPEMPG